LNNFGAFPDECSVDHCKICNDAESCYKCVDGFQWKWRGTLCELITTTTTTTTTTTDSTALDAEGSDDHEDEDEDVSLSANFVGAALAGEDKKPIDAVGQHSSAHNVVIPLLALLALCAL